MKKYYFFLVFTFLFINSINAQKTYVPDDHFEQALIDLGYDDVLDDYVITANISGVTSLEVYSKNISDLTGIEGFTSLQELHCPSNQLVNIDLSNNTALTVLRIQTNSLTGLDITNNTNLTKIVCSYNQLTDLDVSQNINLNHLDFKNNQLTSIDISKNTELTYLNLSENNITDLNVSKNTELLGLICTNNKLTNLDVTQNVLLKYLYCGAGGNQITNLDVTHNINLTHLVCSGNHLTQMDLSKNKLLSHLDFIQNNLISIDLSQNLIIETLDCRYNQLLDLDLSKNTKIKKVYCGNNQLKTLDIKNGNNTIIKNFDANFNYIKDTYVSSLNCIQVDDATAANAGDAPYTNWNKDYATTYSEDCSGMKRTYVPDDNFEQALIDQGYDDVLDDYVISNNISGITSLDVSNKTISNLTGIEDFTALINLQCYQNQLTSLDISQNTNLQNLGCSQNQLTALNVSKNTSLISLSFLQNKITSIDISKNTSLTYLACGVNKLSNLDLSNNTALAEVSCYMNPLGGLDISNNPDLNYLSCYDNQLTSLDISNNTSLKRFYCNDNQLSSLDLSQHTSLTDLYCNNNELTELNVKNGANGILTNFDATNNSSLQCIQVDNESDASNGNGVYATWQKDVSVSYSENCSQGIAKTYIPDDHFEQALITSGIDKDGVVNDSVATADISGITYLAINNQDISDLTGIEDFTSLKQLICSDNKLTGFDLSHNLNLTELNCSHNQLGGLDLSLNIFLEKLNCGSTGISSIDVTNNTALSELNCGNNNQLTSLDISRNTALTLLDATYSKITALDLTNNTVLERLSCNSNQLTVLDLSKNTVLTSLSCDGNPLTSLNVKNGNNSIITNFWAKTSSLTCIQVDDATKANAGQPPYDTWHKDAATTYSEDCSGSNSTSIPDSKFEQALIDLGIISDTNINGSVSKTEISVVTHLDVSGLDISDLSGIEDFTSLETLIVSNNQLTYLDLRNNINLKYLDVSGNPLITLLIADDDQPKPANYKNRKQIVVTNNNLTEINIRDTQLDTIALSGIPHLEIFKAQNSKLASLNVSSNGNLVTMDIRNNPLTCIQVSQTQMNNIPSGWQKDTGASYNTDCQSQLSIDDIALENGLILYPNPVSDMLTIDSKPPLNKVEIYSVLGQEIKEINSGFNSISTRYLSRGIYMIKIYSEKGVAVRKLIKE
jgi:Leucine-rich repeat (LRR) protein